MIFSNKIYDKLKFLAQIALPAFGTLYAAVSGTWGWPNTEEVVGTVVAVDFFLGTLLGISTKQYEKSDAAYDGVFVDTGTDEEGVRQLQLDVSRNPDALLEKDRVVLKVVREN